MVPVLCIMPACTGLQCMIQLQELEASVPCTSHSCCQTAQVPLGLLPSTGLPCTTTCMTTLSPPCNTTC
jgi:hypothetical protein